MPSCQQSWETKKLVEARAQSPEPDDKAERTKCRLHMHFRDWQSEERGDGSALNVRMNNEPDPEQETSAFSLMYLSRRESRLALAVRDDTSGVIYCALKLARESLMSPLDRCRSRHFCFYLQAFISNVRPSEGRPKTEVKYKPM